MILRLSLIFYLVLVQYTGFCETFLQVSESDSIQIITKVREGRKLMKQDYDAAFQILSEAQQTAENLKFQFGLLYTNLSLGDLNAIHQKYEKSYIHYNLASQYCQGLHNEHLQISVINSNLSNIYTSLGDYRQSLQKLFDAYSALSIDTLYESYQANTLNNIASNYINLNLLDSALSYTHQSLKLKMKHQMPLGTVYNNIAKAHFLRGDLDSTSFYGYRSISAKIKDQQHVFLNTTYHLLAEMYLRQEQYDSCMVYLQKLDAIIKEFQLEKSNYKTHQLKADLYYKTGDYQEVAYHLIRLNEELKSQTDQNNLILVQSLNLKNLLEKEQKAKELALIERELNEAKISSQKYLLISFSILAFTLIVLLYYAYSLMKRSKQIQADQQNEIDRMTTKLLNNSTKLAKYSDDLSHKIRGPIASILGLLNLIQSAKTSEEKELYIKKLIEVTPLLDHSIREQVKEIFEDWMESRKVEKKKH
ncbi:MAG: hypothetical protein LAT68_14995 [Cyclobacteriaceae bacterium]|nr:hypothetical protein [Cyclobacteriaceae bacterium]MCH8517627.1 hypothetical protein [Cyclobacteriaceae bacterium]